MIRSISYGLLVVCLVMSGCGGGGGGGSSDPSDGSTPITEPDDNTGGDTPTPDVNNAPVASVEAPKTILAGDTVVLDGTQSDDPDGDVITFHWSLSTPNGSQAALSNENGAKPQFVADEVGTYVVTLVVNDGEVDSDPVTASIDAELGNVAPVAVIHGQTEGRALEKVTLDGSDSSDANGDALSYIWTAISAPSGSQAALLDINKPIATFTPDLEGTYEIQLEVSDGVLTSEPAVVTVTVSQANRSPVADLNTDVNGKTGSDGIALDIGNSYDPDGDTISASWRLISQPDDVQNDPTFSDTTGASTTFAAYEPGDYVVGVTLKDSRGASTDARITVHVAWDEVPPSLKPIPDAYVLTGIPATFNSSYVDNPDGASYGISYTLVSSTGGNLYWSKSAGSNGSLEPGGEPVSGNYIQFRGSTPGQFVIEVALSQRIETGNDQHANVTISTERWNVVVVGGPSPVADAGADQKVTVNDMVMLDGTGSSDPDGDTLTYSWTLVSSPNNVEVELDNPASATPAFTPSVKGDYVFQLSVTDGVSTRTDNVMVSAYQPGLILSAQSSVGDDWIELAMPFAGSGSMTLTLVGDHSKPVEVMQYKLTAFGGDYTIQNVNALGLNSNGTVLRPHFVGLVSGQVIKDGDSVVFSIVVDDVATTGGEVRWTFDTNNIANAFTTDRTITIYH